MDEEIIRSSEQAAAAIGLADRPLQGTDLQTIIWGAAESLISPDLFQRMNGLERLIEQDMIRQLPLLAYLLITRVEEPDIVVRTRIVKTLGEIASAEDVEAPLADAVQRTLIYHISRFRTREIFALLQVSEYDKSAEPYVSSLLSRSSFAGDHLKQILSARETPDEVRRQAAHYIGVLGFLEALPTIERMASRLTDRCGERDKDFYLELQNAIERLTAS